MISTSSFGIRCRRAVLPAALTVVSLVLHLFFFGASVSLYDPRSSLGPSPVKQLPHQLSERDAVPFEFNRSSYKRVQPRQLDRPSVDYNFYVCKGQRALQMIQNDASSTKVWTMADLNNGWTVEIRDGKEPNQEVEPALEGLGISYDTGVEGRDNTQDQPFTDKDGNGNQPATKGFYITAFLTNGGTIIAENNRSPARQAPGAKIPPLWRWSDVTWLQWSTLAGARAAGLRYIIQDNIYTELTRYVIEHIEMAVPPLYDLDLPWPGHLYNAQSQQALMLLGSPHGIGVAWMLADHKDVLGIRYPWARIYTQPNDNPDRSGREYDYFLVWELRDTAT